MQLSTELSFCCSIWHSNPLYARAGRIPIITWSRALAGRWKDAQLASDILIGAAVGTLLLTLILIHDASLASRFGLDTMGGLFLLNGTRYWITGVLGRISEGMIYGLGIFFAIFGFRTVFRREWIAALAGALTFLMLQGDLANAISWQTELAVYVLLQRHHLRSAQTGPDGYCLGRIYVQSAQRRHTRHRLDHLVCAHGIRHHRVAACHHSVGVSAVTRGPGARMTRRAFARMASLGGSAGLLLHGENDGPTRRLADFVVATKYSDLPTDLIEVGRKSMLDGIGLALVGSVARSGELIRAYIESLGISKTDATLIGTPVKSAVSYAALANGIGIHADDYDDTQLSSAPDRVYGLLTHPTAPVLSSALAVAESQRLSGRDLILAYHLGVEAECKIAEAIAPRHYQDGFHSTGTCGVFGSVVAAMKLRRADAATLTRAIGIGASEAAGLRENFGTMTKPFHAGRAAQSGIVAADLAALGWTASSQILEAPNGFFHAAGGGYDASALTFGKPWTFLTPGVSIKPFPSGSLTHPGMTALLQLLAEHDVKPDQVERLDVGTNRNMPNALIHHKPTDSLQAKFSMEFCMAALLLYRRAGLNEFT